MAPKPPLAIPGITVSATRPPPEDIASFRELLNAVTGMTATGNEADDLFSSLRDAVQKSQGSADAASGAYTSAVRSGAPQTSPLADLVARSLGGLAQGLTGRENGPQLAERTIAGHQEMLTAQHATELEALAGAYGRAAERANRLGDTETELKMRERLDQRRLQQAEKLNVLKLLAQQRLSERSATAQSGRERVAQEAAANRTERVALIMQGINPDTGLPLPVGGGHPGAAGKAGTVLPGFVTEAQAQTNFNKLIGLAKEKGAFGANYREKRMLNFIMDNYRPSVKYAADPQGFMTHLMTLYSPDGRPIIPRDPKDPAVPRSDIQARIKALIQNYWPGTDVTF